MLQSYNASAAASPCVRVMQLTSIHGARILMLASLPRHRAGARRPLRIGTPQGFWGSGYFNEDSERAPPNLLKAVENKKLLSTAGKLKLLSSADKAGFNLAKVANMCSAAVRAAHVSLRRRCAACAA